MVPKTVMIVDDDPGIREAIGDFLEEMGYSVQAAANGRVALSRLQQGFRPAIILLDLMMPQMNGQEFRAAQQQDPRLSDIPVVILSAQFDVATEAESLDVAGWLRKPPQLENLLQLVEQHIR